jgi:hypothetical protein
MWYYEASTSSIARYSLEAQQTSKITRFKMEINANNQRYDRVFWKICPVKIYYDAGAPISQTFYGAFFKNQVVIFTSEGIKFQ